MHRSQQVLRGVVVVSAALIWAAGAAAQSLDSSPQPSGPVAQDLKRLTIEELAELDVTSASRRLERLDQTAAAISVIRQEDIRRSGATTLAEALRLADGLHVSRTYGPGWAITARGFSIGTANKMLVMIDGRTVYSPLFSGVFWEVQDVVLADIDRIEVIRGPGGALWGANAVNGVINIITKRAADTRGGLVVGAGGTETHALTTVRYGGRVGAAGGYRVYGQFRADDDHVFATGAPGQDDFELGQVGFRIDSDDAAAASWSLSGDFYYGLTGLYDRPDTRLSGGNLLGRWTRRWSSTSEFQAIAYYDRTFRRVEQQYRATRDTVDLDVQQRLQAGARHSLVFGGGVRASRGDDLGDGPGFFFEPQVRTSTLLNAFAQDEIALTSDDLVLTLGAKLEANDFTGLEVSPTARLRWSPGATQTFWTAVSRAVRMPTRFDTDLRIRFPASTRLLLTGSEDFASENVVAYEAGYRIRPARSVSLDITAYSNRYTDLRSQEPPAVAGAPFTLANGLRARTSGAEASAQFSLSTFLQARASYAYLWKDFSRAADSRDITGGTSEANDPSHLFSFRAYGELPGNFELDTFLRFVSELPQPLVGAYTELDVRLGWPIRPRFDLSIVGKNLLHDAHLEFAGGTPREEFERAVLVRATWRF
jgi:iron complex outermembrane recepter protein